MRRSDWLDINPKSFFFPASDFKYRCVNAGEKRKTAQQKNQRDVLMFLILSPPMESHANRVRRKFWPH